MKHEAFVDGICAILKRRKVISHEEAESLKKAFKGSEKPYFDDFLLEEGLVDKDDLLLALSEYYQVPACDVIGYFFDHALVRMFPKELLFERAVIPLELDENILIMVASNPDDPELLPMIGEQVSYDIQFQVGIRSDITTTVREFYDKSLTAADFDEDLDETREEREHEIEQHEEVEELAYEDFEQDE